MAMFKTANTSKKIPTHRDYYKPAKSLVILASPLVLNGCSSFSQPAAPVTNATPSVISEASLPQSAPGSTPVQTASATTTTTAPYQEQTTVAATLITASNEQDAKIHIVKPGETLFRIATNNNLSYSDIMKWNNISDTTIHVGQALRLSAPDQEKKELVSVKTDVKPLSPATQTTKDTLKAYPKALKIPYSQSATATLIKQSEGEVTPPHNAAITTQTITKQNPDSMATTPKTKAPNPAPDMTNGTDEKITWSWPAKGNILNSYSNQNKGIDIKGEMGAPIIATADGKVVYSGSGLRGYGKLVIIKHNKAFLSAYAHNSKLLVSEGQSVKKGQKIAEMGNTDASEVKLHFEIRRFGEPVDPMQYLERSS